MGGIMTNFKFNISLNVLNHLGRGLYRNFITVIGEAVSNSWDADAKNVWIYINRDKNYFVIKDDGTGMSEEDFRNKFLKIGYSKRKGGSNKTPGGRPYIGNKGIGKLALLSCAKVVNIISRKKGNEYTGGIIDNSELDDAIVEDLDSTEYLLGGVRHDIFEKYTKNHGEGTIIYFDQFNKGVRNSIELLRKAIALYFRFSLFGDFKIHVDDKEITLNDLQELIGNTEFLWEIEGSNDPYVSKLRKNLDKSNTHTLKKESNLPKTLNLTGFVASVEKPKDLNIFGIREKVGIDLFVNGRLRETNILKLHPTFATRHVASYLYGQIHYNDLDNGMDDVDRFTTSREGIKPEDKKVEDLIDCVKEHLNKVSNDWDKWRFELKKPIDPEKSHTKKMKSRELFNIVSSDLVSPGNATVDEWVNEIGKEAEFNYPSYAECFISENIIRKYIIKNNISILTVENTIINFQEQEEVSKHSGNIYINIRPNNPSMKGLDYLSMDDLVGLLNKKDPNKYAGFLTNAKEYKPFRNAVAHTAILTLEAQKKLNTVYENIKEHIKYILK